MKAYAFGIDIGGTTVKIGCFQSDGTLQDKWEIETRRDDDGAKVLPDIADTVNGYLSEHGISIEEVEGIGLGVPGPVLPDGTVNRCVNLGWGVIAAGEELSGLLSGVPVLVGNDANVAALGEQWRGGGKGFENVIMVTLGTGVGGGIILGGKILAGSHGAVGEIGHILVNRRETETCGCGKRGCLEQYVSATGVARKAREVLAEKGTASSLSALGDAVTAKDVYDAAKQGDAAALEIAEWAGRLLGEAISYLTLTVDPDVIVVGGGVSKAGQILIDAVSKYYQPAAFHATRETPFKLAVLGNDAGMYGAVRMVLGR